MSGTENRPCSESRDFGQAGQFFCQGDAKVSEEGKQEQEDEVAEK